MEINLRSGRYDIWLTQCCAYERVVDERGGARGEGGRGGRVVARVFLKKKQYAHYLKKRSDSFGGESYFFLHFEAHQK